MLLTLTAPAPSMSSTVARHARSLAALLCAVLLAHWLVLGPPLHTTLAWLPGGSASSGAEDSSSLVLQTRSIGHILQSAAPAAPEPPALQPQVVPTPAPAPAPRHAQQRSAEPATVAAQQAEPSLRTEPDAPPPPPPSGPDSGKSGAAAVATLAAGAAQASDAPLRLVYPEPARLKYEVRAEIKGISLTLNGELLWQHDGKTYNSRLEFSHFLLGSRMQTSKGTLGPQGLEPLRFGDKVRSEVAAHFDRSANKVTFSANTPDVPLTPGMQDQLSAVLQLSAMFGGEPQRYPAGTQIPFEAIGPRSVESWTMVVGNTEKLSLPGGDVSAIKLSRGAVGPNSNRAEIWLAPSMGYLPVRIRLTEANGDVADKLWRSTQPP